MSGDSSEEKTRPASNRKLRKLREDGQLPQSAKMVTLGTTAVGLGLLLAIFPGIVTTLTGFFDSTFRQIGQPAARNNGQMITDLFSTLFAAVAPVIGIVAVTAILLPILFYKGIPFSITPLIPDVNKLNPADGLTRLINKRGLIECGIGIVQIALWTGIAGLILNGMLKPMLALHGCGLPCAGAVAGSLGRSLVYAAIGFCIVMMVLDMLVQQALYADEQRMTETEHKREVKDQHGSPETRRERHRQRNEARKDADMNRDFGGVDRANMCFFTAENAVAIRYHPKSAPLPRVASVALGPEAAMKLRQAVAANRFRELEDEAITNGCLKVKPGGVVPEGAFNDLVRGMSKLFG